MCAWKPETENYVQLPLCQLLRQMKHRVTCGELNPVKHITKTAVIISFSMSSYVLLLAIVFDPRYK